MIQRFLLQQELPQVFGPFGLVPACRCQGSAGILSPALEMEFVPSFSARSFLPGLSLLAFTAHSRIALFQNIHVCL